MLTFGLSFDEFLSPFVIGRDNTLPVVICPCSPGLLDQRGGDGYSPRRSLDRHRKPAGQDLKPPLTAERR
jgi:hypothetical protein